MRPINRDAVVELTAKMTKLADELRDFSALLSHEQRELRAEGRVARWAARKQLALRVGSAAAMAPVKASRYVARGVMRVALAPLGWIKRTSAGVGAVKPARKRRAKTAKPSVAEVAVAAAVE
jgi:hypothetical protein